MKGSVVRFQSEAAGRNREGEGLGEMVFVKRTTPPRSIAPVSSSAGREAYSLTLSTLTWGGRRQITSTGCEVTVEVEHRR